jgi:hypothetical protein
MDARETSTPIQEGDGMDTDAAAIALYPTRQVPAALGQREIRGMTTFRGEQEIKRLPLWPRWHFDRYSFPRRYGLANGGRGLSVNEGFFPNFCIQRKGWRIDFIYVALAPGLRFHWSRKP